MLSSIQSTTFATSHLCLFVTPRSDPAAVLVFCTASHHPLPLGIVPTALAPRLPGVAVGESVWRVLEGFGGFWRFWRVLEGFEGLRAGTIESHCCGLGPGTIESHCCGLGPGVQDTCQGCSEVALALGCLFLTPHIFELKPPPFASVGMFPLLWH